MIIDIFTIIAVLSFKVLPNGKRISMNMHGACALCFLCCMKPRQPVFILYLSLGFASRMQITISTLDKVDARSPKEVMNRHWDSFLA